MTLNHLVASFGSLQSGFVYLRSRREWLMLLVAASWNHIIRIPKERSCPVLDKGRDRLSVSKYSPHFCSGGGASISVHSCHAVDLERGRFEGGHVLNRITGPWFGLQTRLDLVRLCFLLRFLDLERLFLGSGEHSAPLKPASWGFSAPPPLHFGS